MKITNSGFTFIVLCLLVLACGNNNAKRSNNFTIETGAKNNNATVGDTLNLSILNKKQMEISSVVYKIGDMVVENPYVIKGLKLGAHNLTATVSHGEVTEQVSTMIYILNNVPPKIYGYKIINEYPHDIRSYTQGLEFHNGILYESTGQYGESKLRKLDYKTGEVLNNINLSNQYFGEGLTILNNAIYQLTWKEQTGFVYDVSTFEKTGSFRYGQSKEGWGICNDGKVLFKSDGTENIWQLNPDTQAEEGRIQAYHNRGKVVGLNELEWIDGKIFANRYQLNGVAIINPTTGAVEGVVDFSPLKDLVTQHSGLDVLNGIAYNPDTKTIFVTGKRWDKLFEVELVEK